MDFKVGQCITGSFLILEKTEDSPKEGVARLYGGAEELHFKWVVLGCPLADTLYTDKVTSQF